MRVYLVRHGESTGNVDGRIQFQKECLTPRGKEQAKVVRDRFSGIELDTIIVSSHVRTVETAEIINEHFHLPFQTSDLFVEFTYPSAIHGLGRRTEAREVLQLLQDNQHNPDFRHSDEETFEIFKNRGKEALAFLEKFSNRSEEMLVVTHATFIKLLLGLMLFGDDLDSYQLARMREVLMTRNTSITLCEYSQNEKEVERWRIWSYNDHAHLAEE